MLIACSKVAIDDKDRRFTYRELLQHIDHYAETFNQYGSSDKIVILAENSIEWVIALYATWRNNGVVIPVDALSTPKEIAHILSDASPTLIFTSSEKKAVIEEVVKELGIEIPLLTASDIPEISKEDKDVLPFIPEDDSKTALINYTSGTTGYAKGVMLSFGNLKHNLFAVCTDIQIFREEHNTLMLLPAHHILPLMGSIIAPLFVGATIYVAKSLATDVILDTLNRGKISIIIGVPRLYEALAKGIMSKIEASSLTKWIYKIANKLQCRQLSTVLFKTVHQKFGGHIRYLVSGGAALPVNVGNIFKTLGFEILEGYGMTETAPMITFTRPGKWYLGYAGYPVKGMEIKIEDGEVCVKGPNVMQGYYNRPEETDEIIRDGWLYTGDMGVIDKRGLKLTTRRKELIVTSNGKNIDPIEVETEFYKQSAFTKEVGVFMHDGILQAILYPDMEQIRAKSVTNLAELMREIVMEFNKKIAPYKRFKRFHIVSEELPKTRMGKLQRFKLHELIEEQKKESTDKQQEYPKNYLLLKEFVEYETGNTAAENDHFEIDLAMDSLSRVALLAFVETQFGLMLSEKHFNELNTLEKLHQYIEENASDVVVGEKKKLEWKDVLTAKVSNMTLPTSGLTGKTIHFVLRYLLKIVYRYKSRGVENIPNEPCIIVANHQSMLDGVLVTTSLKGKLNKNTFLFAKEKHWKNRFMSFMARKNNVILMDINNNLREALLKISYVLQNGKNVLIFPEGTRSKEGLQEFKDTFAILSKELNVPIVPVVIHGSDRAVFNKIKLPRYFTRLSVNFLQTVYPTQNESYTDLKNRVKTIISNKIEALKMKA